MWFIVLAILVVALVLVEKSKRKTGPVSPGLQPEICFAHQSEWTLYHNDFSLCSKKIRLCLAELGVDYDSRHIDLIETGAYQNISRDFLAINPASTVPVLLHNGHPIYESHEQIRYAVASAGDASQLMPKDADKAALVESWVDKTSLVGDNPIAGAKQTMGNAVPGLTVPIFAAMISHIPYYKIVEGLLFHRFKSRAIFFMMMKNRGLKRVPDVAPVKKAIALSHAAMRDWIAQLETQLSQSDGNWIAGETFTLADVGVIVILDRLREGAWLADFLTAETPATCSYWDRVQQRHSYQQACLGHQHPRVVQATLDIERAKEQDSSFLRIQTNRGAEAIA